MLRQVTIRWQGNGPGRCVLLHDAEPPLSITPCHRTSDYPHFTDKEIETSGYVMLPKSHRLEVTMLDSSYSLETSGRASWEWLRGGAGPQLLSPAQGWHLPLVMLCRRKQRKSGSQLCPMSRSRKQHFLGKLSRGTEKNRSPSGYSFLEWARATESPAIVVSAAGVDSTWVSGWGRRGSRRQLREHL